MSIRTPTYRLHRGSGQALVQINGRRIYLGKYDSEASKERYRRVVAEWLRRGSGRSSSAERPLDPESISVNRLLQGYWEFARGYYQQDGRPTKELTCMREALRPLRELYGLTPAIEFGPRALKAVREHMIDAGLSTF